MSAAAILKSGAEVLQGMPDFKLVGREKELATLMNILGRRSAHNVLLTGQPGVGCSSLCYGLQLAKSDPNVPFDIIHKRIWWLDSDGLFADPDKTEELFDAMIARVSDTSDADTILVIEDAKNFIESINNSGNASFVNQMMRQIELNRMQVIMAVRDQELEMVLNAHSCMREQFTILEVNPPTGDKLRMIVKASAATLTKHHGITIDDDAIEQAIYLTTTYPGKERSLMRAQPDASLTLLDRALSVYKNESHANPPHLVSAREALSQDPENPQLQARVNQLTDEWQARRKEAIHACEKQAAGESTLLSMEKELEAIRATKKNDDTNGFMMIGREEQELLERISAAKGLIKQYSDKYKAFCADANNQLRLMPEHVFAKFSRLSGIPFDKLKEDEGKKLLALPELLKQRIFGQDHVVHKVSDALLTSSVPGLKARGKPDAAFMFCGSSGTGKTEMVKALAAILKDDELALLRFDMSEFSEKNNVTTLVGAPPGYTGYENGGILTNAIRKRPHAIVLFDEIEKAHVSIYDIFLQVLDEGRLTDTQGRTVSFENTILVFTTNTGAEHMLNSSLSYEEQCRLTLASLSEKYRAEFLNRFEGRQNIVMFKVLPKEVIHDITRQQLKKVNAGMAANGLDMKLSMDDEDIIRLCDYHYAPESGARGIDGLFRMNVYSKLARLIKTGEASNRVKVSFADGEFTLAASLDNAS